MPYMKPEPMPERYIHPWSRREDVAPQKEDPEHDVGYPQEIDEEGYDEEQGHDLSC